MFKPVPRLSWVANYSDGTQLTQLGDGTEASSEAVDRSKLASFSLLDLAGNVVLNQQFERGDLFAYRCRSILRTDKSEIERIHILSVTRGEFRQVAFVFESDFHIELGDFAKEKNRQNLHRHDFVPVSADLQPIGE